MPLLDKLEDKRGKDHIELVAVRPAEADPETRLSATVFVPEAKRELYLKKVEDYRTQETPTGKPKNQPLVASLEDVRLAHARSLFDKLFDRRQLIRLIGVRFSGLVHGSPQLNLFEDSTEEIRLLESMDKIRRRFGSKAIIRGAG